MSSVSSFIKLYLAPRYTSDNTPNGFIGNHQGRGTFNGENSEFSLVNVNEYDFNDNKVINDAFFPHMVLKAIKKDKLSKQGIFIIS